MGARQEEIVLSCLEQFHSAGVPDLDRIAQLFAEDAVYIPLVPRSTPKRGRPSIVTELGAQFARYRECRCEIIAIASTERHVFTERRDHVTMRASNQRLFSSVNAVFEFDADNRIVSWREYWDSGDIALQLGTTAEAIQQLMSENA